MQQIFLYHPASCGLATAIAQEDSGCVIWEKLY